MTKNSLRILRILAMHLKQGSVADIDPSGMKRLLGEGFSPQEVEDACSWIGDLTINGDLCMAVRDSEEEIRLNRLLNPVEALKINQDAYGFLVRLREMGLIDSELQEEIIEMAMLTNESDIGMEEIKSITAMLIFDYAPSQWKSNILNMINDRDYKNYH